MATLKLFPWADPGRNMPLGLRQSEKVERGRRERVAALPDL
jgi:hypothetical protein